MIQLETCKTCDNRTVSRSEGMLCGLTQAKPTFTDTCPSYVEDPIQAKRMERHNKQFNPKEINRETAIKALIGGIPLLGIGFFLIIFPMPLFVGIIGLLCLLLGILSIAYGIIKYATIDSTPTSKESNKPSEANDDLEVI
jgi:hypothetical protein